MWSIHRNRPADADESVTALKNAVRSLAEVDKIDPEVREVANSFRQLRTANHFSEKIALIMGGK